MTGKGLGDLSDIAGNLNAAKMRKAALKKATAKPGKDLKSVGELPSSGVLLISRDEIYSEKQVRVSFNRLKELGETMRREGQLQPIVVGPRTERGYPILAGERRWRASAPEYGNIPKLLVLIETEQRSGLKKATSQLIENIQREALTPFEIAAALKEYADEGWKNKEIAEELQMSDKWVSLHLSLNNVPDIVYRLFEEGACSDAETLNTLRKLHEVDPDRCRAICETALVSGITRKQAANALSDAKLSKDAESHAANIRQEPVVPNPVDQYERDTGISVSSNEDSSANVGDQEQVTTAGSSESVTKITAQELGKKEGTWVERDPGSASIAVRVATDKDVVKGLLVLDRIDKDPTYMWVKVVGSPQGGFIRAHVSDIEIVEVLS